MKRVIATSLLLVFTLNVFGYYAVFVGARFRATEKIRESFDIDNYQRSAETTFKVPLTLPYGQDMNEWRAFFNLVTLSAVIQSLWLHFCNNLFD